MKHSKKCIKLTDTDRENIISIIKESLQPLDLGIEIPQDYGTIYCRMRSENQEELWEEYFYHIKITVESKTFEVSRPFDSNKSVFEIAWLIAWKIFSELKLDYRGEVAKSLWDKRKDIKEKYQTTTWDKA